MTSVPVRGRSGSGACWESMDQRLDGAVEAQLLPGPQLSKEESPLGGRLALHPQERSVAAVTGLHGPGGQRTILPFQSEDLQPRFLQARPLEALELTASSSPTSRGYLDSLAQGSFLHLQRQQLATFPVLLPCLSPPLPLSRLSLPLPASVL